MAHNLTFVLRDGVVFTELVPDSFLYVARSPETGEVVATIDSDEQLDGLDEGAILELCPHDGRCLWITRVLH